MAIHSMDVWKAALLLVAIFVYTNEGKFTFD